MAKKGRPPLTLPVGKRPGKGAASQRKMHRNLMIATVVRDTLKPSSCVIPPAIPGSRAWNFAEASFRERLP